MGYILYYLTPEGQAFAIFAAGGMGLVFNVFGMFYSLCKRRMGMVMLFTAITACNSILLRALQL